jgi:hypothetical protein
MSEFLFRKPPKVILDKKTLEDKKRIKINPADIEETEEVFDVPDIMKSDDTENWEQYKFSSIDELLKEAGSAPRQVVHQFFLNFIQKLVHQVQIRDDIENIKTELKNEFGNIFNNYVQYTGNLYNKKINTNNENDLLWSDFKEIIREYRIGDIQSDREYAAIINVLKFILEQ